MRYEIEGKLLSDIGDAIREKTGKSELILPGDMPGEIRTISDAEVDQNSFLIYDVSSGSNGITYQSSKNIDNMQLIVIVMNSEASTYDLIIEARKNDTILNGETLSYSEYSNIGDNRRNNRIVIFNFNLSKDDIISISVYSASSHTYCLSILTKSNIRTVKKVITTPDGYSTGTYEDDCIVFYGTFNNNVDCIFGNSLYEKNKTIRTSSPGSNYKSSFIYWLK